MQLLIQISLLVSIIIIAVQLVLNIVVIGVYLLKRLHLRDEEVIVEDFAAILLSAILNDDVHGLLLDSLEEAGAALAHFRWLRWHRALHSRLSGPRGWLVEVAKALMIPRDVIVSAIVFKFHLSDAIEYSTVLV